MSPSEEVLAEFRRRAEAVAAQVEMLPDLKSALARAVEIAAAKAPGGLVAAEGWEAAERGILTKAVRTAGLELAGPGYREQADRLAVGITPAHWGIAATGTLVLDSRDEDFRLATMLSEVHVAVLAADRVRPTAADLEPELTALNAAPPAYTAFITGASRTADIERVLAIGVHGPVELVILLTGGGA